MLIKRVPDSFFREDERAGRETHLADNDWMVAALFVADEEQCQQWTGMAWFYLLSLLHGSKLPTIPSHPSIQKQ
jgi:hypothetical protein